MVFDGTYCYPRVLGVDRGATPMLSVVYVFFGLNGFSLIPSPVAVRSKVLLAVCYATTQIE